MKPQDIVELVIESSSHCNSRCPHCPRFTEDGYVHPDLPLGHLTTKQLKGLDPTQLTNLKIVTFEGDKGDPVMNPALLDLIGLFPTSVRIVISSNGGIRSRAWWRQLAQLPNVTVNFSIDGLADTNHLYRIGVNYSRAIGNAQSFIKAGGIAHWRCLVFQHNQHQIEEIKQISSELGFASVQFRMPHLTRFQGLTIWPVKIDGKYSHDLLPATMTEKDIQAHGRVHKTISKHRFENTLNKSRCPWASHNKLYINFQAHVLPCCMMHFETLNNYPGQLLFSKLVTTFDRISLEHAHLEDILLLYDSKLEPSLKNRDTMLPVCKKICFQ